MKLKLQAIAIVMLTILSLWFASPSWADVMSDADVAFSPWSVESIEQEGSTLIVSLDETQITQKLYKSVILDGMCYVVTGADQAEFSGIRQVKVVNKFKSQGYAFEGDANDCFKLVKANGRGNDSELLNQTHLVF